MRFFLTATCCVLSLSSLMAQDKLAESSTAEVIEVAKAALKEVQGFARVKER